MMTSETKPRILMVEDEEDIAFLIRFLLERQGFEVEHAPDGRRALELLSDISPVNLALLDIMLPYHDGLEVLERLRGLPAWQDVPVIMLTAKAREADVVRALELGADDYVTKPFQPEELLARLRRFMRRR